MKTIYLFPGLTIKVLAAKAQRPPFSPDGYLSQLLDSGSGLGSGFSSAKNHLFDYYMKHVTVSFDLVLLLRDIQGIARNPSSDSKAIRVYMNLLDKQNALRGP